MSGPWCCICSEAERGPVLLYFGVAFQCANIFQFLRKGGRVSVSSESDVFLEIFFLNQVFVSL